MVRREGGRLKLASIKLMIKVRKRKKSFLRLRKFDVYMFEAPTNLTPGRGYIENKVLRLPCHDFLR